MPTIRTVRIPLSKMTLCLVYLLEVTVNMYGEKIMKKKKSKTITLIDEKVENENF